MPAHFLHGPEVYYRQRLDPPWIFVRSGCLNNENLSPLFIPIYTSEMMAASKPWFNLTDSIKIHEKKNTKRRKYNEESSNTKAIHVRYVWCMASVFLIVHVEILTGKPWRVVGARYNVRIGLGYDSSSGHHEYVFQSIHPLVKTCCLMHHDWNKLHLLSLYYPEWTLVSGGMASADRRFISCVFSVQTAVSEHS